MHPRLRVAAAALAVLGLSACGGSTPTPTGAPITAVPTASVASTTPEAVAPGSLAGDTTVTLAPVMYPPGSPCAKFTKDTPAGEVGGACGAIWFSSDVSYVPGQEVMRDAPMPKSAVITEGIPVAAGTADATAFYRWMALTGWAQTHQSSGLLTEIDGQFASKDPVLFGLNHDETVFKVPSCAYPTRIRVRAVSSAVDVYLNQIGWTSPSSTAIVATFPACAGIELATGGGPRYIGASSTPYSQVITGSAQPELGFGDLWQVDGYATCGLAVLTSVCG